MRAWEEAQSQDPREIALRVLSDGTCIHDQFILMYITPTRCIFWKTPADLFYTFSPQSDIVPAYVFNFYRDIIPYSSFLVINFSGCLNTLPCLTHLICLFHFSSLCLCLYPLENFPQCALYRKPLLN